MSERLTRGPTVDVLTDWMQVTCTHGIVLARNELPARWGIAMEARDAAVIHMVPRGRVWMRVEGHAPVVLGEGDLAIVPRGSAHVLADSAATPPIPLAEVLARRRRPFAGPACTTLVCGEYRSDVRLDGSLGQALPELVHFTAAQVAADGALSATSRLLVDELDQTKPGGAPLVRHLLDALFVYVLRAWGAAHGAEGGWLAAQRDPALGRALEGIHARPAHPWTVESLAELARLSRAAFARRFAERLGESPMEYVTRWRMTLASRMLLDADASVGEVARHVGYASEFAFSRAFKRARGVPPARYRRAPGAAQLAAAAAPASTNAMTARTAFERARARG